ncbi:translation initiation factor IF-2 [Culex quinquefasciatus]|uniref:translation initiation factor IF-2 n=1 Tax=Culex quinquefasciatus TaxID=7176 RepID=UPI0018E3B332|nr:translation initiation factor IF-2 [Culex quinquefasciatus]
MDTAVEKSCLDEISHTVLDSKGKISVRTLSNNYEISFADAVKVLQRWIDANGAKAKLSPEFIVRGTDSKGTPFITVANEKRLKVIKAKAEQVSSMLYALEVASESGGKLNIPVDQEFRAISLPLKTDKRDMKVFVPVASAPAAPVVKQEAKPKSIFGASGSKVAPKAEPAKVAPKAEPAKVAPKAEPAKAPAVKEEKQSPPAPAEVKKESPPKKTASSPTKVSPSKKKDAKKPVATGKNSIASFFSNKPGAAKPAAPKPVEKPVEKPAKVKVKEEKPSPKPEAKKPAKEDETPRWKRMISDESSGDDEVIPSTPQDKKPEKKKGGVRKPMTVKKGAGKANPSKKSRIVQVVDSSEEEEEEDRALKEPEERLVAFEVEESDDAEMKDVQELSPEKPVENDSSSANRGRAKVKKLVTKTFMDEEGYLTTIKEYQMVSASEDEGEGESATNNNNSETNGKKESTATGKTGKSEPKTDKKAQPASKVTPPTPKTKQGSIMSFFAKK